MRSFSGRDILSLKEFERGEFFHVFDVAETLEPIARERRNSDLPFTTSFKRMVTCWRQWMTVYTFQKTGRSCT